MFFDQSPTNALQTGQWHNYTVSAGRGDATNYPLRVTLVWTDPPGNPAAGMALVNNLDLVVTDGTGTNVYMGNDFQQGDIYTEARAPSEQRRHASDMVNNVQNVYLDASFGLAPPYTVSVRGTRVNVNAVTTQTNVIGQDYALVISSDDQALAAPLTVTDLGTTICGPARWSRRPATGWRCCTSGWEPTSRTWRSIRGPLPPSGQHQREPGAVAFLRFHQRQLRNHEHHPFHAAPAKRHRHQPGQLTPTPSSPPSCRRRWPFPFPRRSTLSYPAANNADLDLYVSTNSALFNLDRGGAGRRAANRWGRAAARRSSSPTSPRFRFSTSESNRRPSRGGTLRFSRRWRPTSTVRTGNGPFTVSAYGLPVVIPDSFDASGAGGGQRDCVCAQPDHGAQSGGDGGGATRQPGRSLRNLHRTAGSRRC